MQIVQKGGLPAIHLNGEVAAYIFDGNKHGDLSCSAIIIDLQPNLGPPWHTHPYEEVFVIVEGKVRVEVGGESLDATPDEICIIPAGVPHRFTNLGPDRARLVNINNSSEVITEFAEDDSTLNSSYQYDHPGRSDGGQER